MVLIYISLINDVEHLFICLWAIHVFFGKNVSSTLLLVLNMDCLWDFCLLFWPSHAAFGISVPQPGVEPVSSAVEAQGLNRWTAREV